MMIDAPTNNNDVWRRKRICVTGGNGFLGRALCAQLDAIGCSQLFIPLHSDFDLTQADHVSQMYAEFEPDVVIHLAAEVGGIGANMLSPGRFFYANLAMGMNLIEQARMSGVEKFVQVGTVCSYPKHTPTPFCEDELWNGYPEETNAPYGIAKKALLVMLQSYRQQYGLNGIFVMPANLYGPGDSFELESSHVIPALIRKFHDAKICNEPTVTCWGTGQASREFLYVDDAANAIIRAVERYDSSEPINLGTGCEITIADLASCIARLTGYTGKIQWDVSRPDGQPRRRLDTSRANAQLKWNATTDLETGLQRTLEWWISPNNASRQPAAPAIPSTELAIPSTALTGPSNAPAGQNPAISKST